MEKTIKVDENTYKLINRAVGELRMNENRPVSINEALFRMLKEKKKTTIMDFAGAWDMSDAEAEKMKAGLRRMWASWKPKPF